MRERRIVIDGQWLRTWDTFHDTFARELRFFDGYGRNMNAWIDCMSDLEESGSIADMRLAADEILVLEIRGYEELARVANEQAMALLECTAAVNRRWIEWCGQARIAIVPA